MSDKFQEAIGHHTSGRFDLAERIYRDLLREQPSHADSLHLLGVLKHQRGFHLESVELINRAIAIHPNESIFHSNIAEAHRALGNLQRAESHCRRAIELDPTSAEARNNLGLALSKQGLVDEAIAEFEAAFSLKPFWPPPYLNAGNAHRDTGWPHRATAVYREGLRLCGSVAPIQNALGSLLLDLGQPNEALYHLREAIRLRDDIADYQLNLGSCLSALGLLDEATACLQQAAHFAPRLPAAFSQLGGIAQTRGRLEDALGYYEQAVRLEPTEPRFHCQAAHALFELDRVEEAAARYREVIRHRPDFAEAHSCLGYILQDRGEMSAAEVAYRNAIQQRPGYADAYLNLGLLQTEGGELESAIQSFRQALRHDPEHPEALGALAVTLRGRLPEEDEQLCRRVLTLEHVPARRKAILEYGLAQVMDSRERYAGAALLASRANAFFKAEGERLGQQFDPVEHQKYVNQIIRSYSPAHFERVRGWGSDSDQLVFVLGLPRSGTSLIEQILASHPQVFGAGELNAFRDIYRLLPKLTGRVAPGVECIGDLTPELVRSLADRHLQQVRGLVPPGRTINRIVDKMPDNYLMIGLIATLFPRAKIIHTRRDVRDVGLSCWLTHFKNIYWACDPVHIGHRIREYLKLMEHWRTVLPGRLIEVDYEAVVEDLEPQARRLIERLDLPWDSACLQFHKTKRVVRTASMSQVREPLYNRSVGRWKHYREALQPMIASRGSGGIG